MSTRPVRNVTFEQLKIGDSSSLSRQAIQIDLEALALLSGGLDPFARQGERLGEVRPDTSTTESAG